MPFNQRHDTPVQIVSCPTFLVPQLFQLFVDANKNTGFPRQNETQVVLVLTHEQFSFLRLGKEKVSEERESGTKGEREGRTEGLFCHVRRCCWVVSKVGFHVVQQAARYSAKIVCISYPNFLCLSWSTRHLHLSSTVPLSFRRG